MAEPRVVGLDLSLTATAYENPAPVADTGHTSKACTACGHHWDVHTPFRGCFTGCSCKLDPPNQPAPVATEATQEEDGRDR